MQKTKKNHLKTLSSSNVIRAVAVIAFLPMVSHCGKRHDTHFVTNGTKGNLEIAASNMSLPVDQKNSYGTDLLIDQMVTNQGGDAPSNVSNSSRF